MGMGAPSLSSRLYAARRTAARLCAPWPRQASAVGADPLLPLRPAAAIATATTVCVGCGWLLPPVCVWSRRRGKRRAGERRSCASGRGRREYGWCRFQVMVFTPEPDPLKLVATATAAVVVGSDGSLDWSGSCQVQCLVQVQLESEWDREPECAWRKPDQPSVHEYDGHTSRKTQGRI